MAKKGDGYLKSVRKEFKKIVWPTKKETLNYTTLVLILSILTGVLIWVLDKVYSGLLSLIIK